MIMAITCRLALQSAISFRRTGASATGAGNAPTGLRQKMMPCPEEIEQRLPPPPINCEHVVIGGHVVLVNRSSYVVLDIVHFER